MIVSESYRFIFIKTRKVAGSSLELKLSSFLGPQDFMANLDERDRKRGLARFRRQARDLRAPSRGVVPVRFSEHSPVSRALRAFGRPVEHHLIVSVERNPWDRAVSAFFWAMRRADYPSRPMAEQRDGFRRYLFRYTRPSLRTRMIGHYKHRVLSHKHLYMIDGVSMVDHMIRYECLAEDLLALGERLGLPEPLRLDDVGAKTTQRPRKARRYQDFYDDETREFVAELSRWEIEAYGYDFEGEAIPRFTPDPRRHEVKAAFFARHGM